MTVGRTDRQTAFQLYIVEYIVDDVIKDQIDMEHKATSTFFFAATSHINSFQRGTNFKVKRTFLHY